MIGRVDFAEIRARLDVRDVAEGEGLTRRGRDYDCPACGRRLKCRSRDGAKGYCVACQWHGDPVDLIELTSRVDRREAVRIACAMAGLGADGTRRPGDVWRPPERPASVSVELAPEDLEQRMRAVQAAVAQISTEGGEVFETMARYQANGRGAGKMDEWLQAWSGDRLRNTRKSSDEIEVPNPILSVLAVAQPDVIEMLKDPDGARMGRGLAPGP